jgi:hypothetical protein
MLFRRSFLKFGFGIAAFLCAGALPSLKTARTAESLPGRLSDEAFLRAVSDLSEKGGYFRYENFLSNELGFQHVIPALKETVRTGGVYIGVGPEQNFTYISALQPRMAFIIDIRRQNLLEHMMYKALFELSEDRADFLSRLYARKRPAGLDADASVETLFGRYDELHPDRNFAQENISAIKETLTKHKLDLSKEDFDKIEYVYHVFVDAGPDLDYTVGGFGGGDGSPSYEQLMTATDKAGHNWSYLASEANYRMLREMELKNVIVPLVGDFAGEKAIRAVGQYLIDHEAKVSVFYLSNVEQYLFQEPGQWRRFWENVSTLPLDTSSTFIRTVNAGSYGRIGGYGMRFQSLLAPMAETVTAFGQGRLRYYNDVIRMSK